MALSKQMIGRMNKIIAMAQKMIETAEKEAKGGGKGGARRQRRSSADAEKMKAQILAARAKGVPAATLAEKYGVSTAYIYMMK
ncbi:hypothetical protein [Aestuariivirga sp.]|uniref:hypothetical protein n=1 Tax=Aestuariivirga sp. TaxID=2650926 RepID=UPI0035930FC5